MNLVIDSGNTQTKVAVFDKDRLVTTYHIKTFDKTIAQKLLKEHQIDKTIISSVSVHAQDIAQFVQSEGNKVITASHTLNLPLTIKYSTPHTLGIDRLAAAVGANTLYPSENIMVIDAGTAITYEFVSADGVYLGGNIAPGMQLRFKSLNDHTKRLPLIDKEEFINPMGTSTQSAIAAGVIQGIIHEIDGYCHHMESKFNSYRILITGGDAEFFVAKLKNPIFVNLNLVLIGLNRILEYNA